MLGFIKTEKTAWEVLKETTKPIVLYGMGNGADKILDWCESNKVTVQAVFASDAFVRGQAFRGFVVEKFSSIEGKFFDPLIVIAFASESPLVLNYFRELAAKYETIAPHLPLFAEDELVSQAWLKKYEQELQQVYDKLADQRSREVFAGIINYKLSGSMEELFKVESHREQDCRELFIFKEQAVYVDAGAYDGDTIDEFVRYAGKNYQKIIALEPDKKNFKKLERFIKRFKSDKVNIYNVGVWKENTELQFVASGGRQSSLNSGGESSVIVKTIDSLMVGYSVDYIKYDVEGAELEALEGTKQVIIDGKPQLFVAAYHHDNDLWRLPLYIWSLRPDYEIFLRKHPYIPAWEINFLVR